MRINLSISRTETRNVCFFYLFFFSIKFIKSVASLKCDFCDFDIGRSNVPVTTKEEIVSVRPSNETKNKMLFFLKTSIDNVSPCRQSINCIFPVGNFLSRFVGS